MPAAKKSITQCKGAFLYSNGKLPEVYPKESNKIMQESETLQEICKDLGIPENLKSDIEPDFCGWELLYLKLDKGNRINITYS